MMNKFPVLFLALFGTVGCVNEPSNEEAANTPPPRDVKEYTIEQFYKNVKFRGGSFSPDESKLLITSNQTGIYNAFELPIDGSPAKQVTNSVEASIFAISYFPNDNRVLYMKDGNGDEINHIYLKKEDGTSVDLTPYEGAKSSFNGWSKDQKSFFFACNKRDKKYFDLYEMDITNFKSKLLYENKDGLNVASISDDKRYLALVQAITTSNSEMYLYDLQTKKKTHLSKHNGDADFSPQYFSADGKYLYYLTDEGGEFKYLSKYDLATGSKEKLFETNWDVWYAYQSWNDKYRVIGINEDAKTVVKVTDLTNNKEVTLPEIKDGDISSVNISKSEKLMKVSVSSSKSSGDIYVYNFENQTFKKLTNSLNPEMDLEDLVAGEVVRYPSTDNLEIPAILYKPHRATEKEKVPALVFVHGGPGGQSRVSYSSLIQYLVNHGYAVIAVNNRGSSGYGKTFNKLDDKNHGEGDLTDCIKAKDFLAELGYVDTTKIGIIGGSYGGYMTMAALAFAPEEFEVGVNIFGVTNWLRTLKSIPPFWESYRKALYLELGDPFSDDSVRLHKISPLFHASNVTKPLMVLQGANDPRVLKIESDEIVAAVKENGVPVEYVLFEDEGHGFVKKDNEIEAYGKVLEFLDEYLLKKEPV